MELQNLILVGFITFIFSFGVQFGFYIWFRVTKDRIIKDYKTVLDYTSGIVGDGLLVPMANVFAFLAMEQRNLSFFNSSIWPAAMIAGFFITYLFHEGQRYFNLTNWTMTKANNWNLLGLYHAIFMFFESSFLCFVLFSFLKSNNSGSLMNLNFKYGLLVLFLFLISFIYDYWKPLFKRLFQKAKTYSTKTISMLR